MPDGQSEVKIVVKDLVDRGGIGYTYRVLVTPAETGFQLAINDDQIAIPRGSTALIPVTVSRAGYKGPIAIEVLGIPGDGGLKTFAGTVAAGQTSGLVGLTAATDAADFAGEIQVVGKGDQGQVVAASKTIVFAEQTITHEGFGMGGTIPSYARPVLSLTAGVIKPGPILINPEPAKLVVPQGSTVDLKLRVDRTAKEKKKYKLAALLPPTGLSVPELEIGETSTAATAKLTVAPDAPLGTAKLGLVAQSASQGAASGRRRGAGARNSATPESTPPSIAAALIEVEVVRPATLELAEKEVTLTPGSTATLSGKVTRAAPFDGEIDIKLDKLPDGITAEKIKVPANASAFTLTITAAANARATEAVAGTILVYKFGQKEFTDAPGPLRLKVMAKK